MERISEILDSKTPLHNNTSSSNSTSSNSFSTPKLQSDNQSVSNFTESANNSPTPIKISLEERLLANAQTFASHASPGSNTKKGSKDEEVDFNTLIQKVISESYKVIDKKLVDTWLKNISLKAITKSEEKKATVVSLLCPNKFTRQYLKTQYENVLQIIFTQELNVDYPVVLDFLISDLADPIARKVGNVVRPNKDTNLNIKSPARSFTSRTLSENPNSTPDISNLNGNYNFSNFVIGGCNQFAHAACLKVSENPGTSYNPLLIYGGVGLGKTHLANAIGNAARRRKKKVLLASSESFVSELISSLRSNTMDRFKAKFRSIDILIVDDIQFLIGKERTQEEFFHTFNELYGKQKQIIITSDKLPQELIGLEERLRTRFASGLSVDLQAPDFETRVAILTKKADSQELVLSEEVAACIANRITSNVRELEGALTRLYALCNLLGEKPNLEMAQKVVDTINPLKKVDVNTAIIKQAVAKQFNVSINDLTGKRRTQNIALARQVAMFLCRKMTARSFPEIGALFGGRDHSTVIHAIKSMTEKIKVDEELAKNIALIQGSFSDPS